MKQEEKDLLLKDLCARLPYGVFIKHPEDNYPVILTAISKVGFESRVRVAFTLRNSFVMNPAPLIEEIKPYLRLMSSMTSDEWCEFCDASLEDEKSWVWAGKEYRFTPVTHREEFLNSHHFDYRGLIPMGLALEAPKDMYKTE